MHFRPQANGLSQPPQTEGSKDLRHFDFKIWPLFRKPHYVSHLTCVSLIMPVLHFKFLCIHIYKLKFSMSFLSFSFFLFWLHCKAFTTVLPGSSSTFFMVFFSDNTLYETYTDLLSLSECLYRFVCSQPWYSSHILFTVITNVRVSSGLWDLIIFRHKFHEISQVVPGLSGVFSKWKLSEWKLNTETM